MSSLFPFSRDSQMFCLFKLLAIYTAGLYFSHHEIKSLQVTGLCKSEASSAFVNEATNHRGCPEILFDWFSSPVFVSGALWCTYIKHQSHRREWSTPLTSPALMDGSLWIFRKSKTDENGGAFYISKGSLHTKLRCVNLLQKENPILLISEFYEK
jgi:hypothetical protein